MIPSPTPTDARKAIEDFRDYADDVLRSDDDATFTANLRQFVRFQKESEFCDRVFATELTFAHFDSWWHAMARHGELLWPDELRQKLFLQHRLLSGMVDGLISVDDFVHCFFAAPYDEPSAVRFNRQIFQFYAREYLKLANDAINKLSPPLIVSAPTTSPSTSTMDIFISHSSKDAELAGALALLFQISYGLDRKRIRCTSADGYRLEVGANTDDRLKAEVEEARVLVGLITPTSVQSSYVLFELGARWGLRKFIGPLLARGAPARLLPGPIAGINALRADRDGEMHQFLGDIAKTLGLSVPEAAGYAKQLKEVIRLASESATDVRPQDAPDKLATEQEKILIILWEKESGCSFGDLAKLASMALQDAKYYSRELEERELVYIPVEADEVVDVSLTHKGRSYLKKQRLV